MKQVAILLLLVALGWLVWRTFVPRRGPDVVCINCGTHDRSVTRTRGSIWIELLLWMCFLVPGLVYSLWRLTTRRSVCAACSSENIVPPDSPVGQRMLREGTTEPAP